jgi:hypothetical protein
LAAVFAGEFTSPSVDFLGAGVASFFGSPPFFAGSGRSRGAVEDFFGTGVDLEVEEVVVSSS